MRDSVNRTPREKDPWMRGGSGERLGVGSVQGDAPEVFTQVSVGIGFAFPEGWSGMGAPPGRRVGGQGERKRPRQ